MIIYFCDRQLNILGQASTVLPAGNRISQDKTVEDVETGVNSFECVLTWDSNTRSELKNAIKTGNYILKKGGFNGYDSLYQILDTESDTLDQEIQLYAEDAGLDLINTICGPVTLSNRTITQMLRYFLPADWVINVQDAPTTTKTYIWDGDSTCTERIRSVVGLWDCELYYSFDIDKLQVKQKIVNVVKKRGLQEAIPQLRLNYDIDRIVTKSSIADLVTALNVTGGTPQGSETPINLINYNYSYTDPVTGDVYKVDKATGQMRNTTAMDRWSSAIDKDGLWIGSYNYDTTDKAVLAGQARAELQKLSAPAENYEVDFRNLPEDAQIGDRVNIIDDEGELYLEARLLLIETCEAEQTKTATIGEYLLKSSGISQKVIELASLVRKQAESDQYFRDQIQILTETTAGMLNLEVESNIVAGRAFLRAHLYNGGKEVTTQYSEALYKWIKRTDQGEEFLGRGYTLNVDLEEVGYAGTILCRFLRPVLYDLTDHMLVNITDENGENIQVAYAGIYSQPIIRRTKTLRALNRASEENETGYPTLAREVNLYEKEGFREAVSLFTGNKGGFVILKPRADGTPEEILIMDTPDIETAQNVWRWNKEGIGFSPNGYDGPYITAWTIDGKFVADFIQTGILSDPNGNTIFNLDTGALSMEKGNINLGDNFIVTDAGVLSMKRGNINLADNFIVTDSGAVTATSFTASDYVYVNGNSNSYFKIPFKGSTSYYLLLSSQGLQIQIANTSIKNEDYGGIAGLTFKQGNDFTAIYPLGIDAGDSYDNYSGSLHKGELSMFGPNSSAWISCSSNEMAFVLPSTKTFSITGKFSVTGTKSRQVYTEHYEDRLLYAYETPTPLFGDIGEAVLDEEGLCYVDLDDIFSETIADKVEYQVFLQKEGAGDCFIADKTPRYFVIQGTPSLKVAWELKAKQKGYELERLEHKETGLDEYEFIVDDETEEYIEEQEALLYDY